MSWHRPTNRLIRTSPVDTAWGSQSPSSEISDLEYQLDFSDIFNRVRELQRHPRLNIFPNFREAPLPPAFLGADPFSDDDSDMSEGRPPKYNGELGKQQELFFYDARAFYRKMCFRKDRVLQSYEGFGHPEFLDVDLRDCLGTDASNVTTTFLQ